MIEFAIIFPLLFLIVMGLFDIGRAVFVYANLNTAAREGTRFAIVQPDCDYRAYPETCDGAYSDTYPLDCAFAASEANINICNEVESRFFLTNLSSSTITIGRAGTSEAPVVTIDIDYNFEPVTPGVALLGDLPIHANSQMLMSPVALP